MKTEKKFFFIFAAVFVDNMVKNVLILFLFLSVALIFARSACKILHSFSAKISFGSTFSN